MFTRARKRSLLVPIVATATIATSAPALAAGVDVPLPQTPVKVPETTVTTPAGSVSAGPGGATVTLGPGAGEKQPPPAGGPGKGTGPASRGGGSNTSTPATGSNPGGKARSPGPARPRRPQRPSGATAGEVPNTGSSAASGTRGVGAARASGGRDRRHAATPGGRTSVVERIVSRIPTEFVAALGAALLAALLFAGVWLRERRRARRARREALVDPVTGIANRLAFDQRLSNEWRRSRRYDRPLGLLVMDLDDLKRINDEEGHAAGDEALRAVAQSISADIRQSDLAARIGGDEFVVLSPETVKPGLDQLADKLRNRLRAEGLRISIGAAEYDAADASADDLVARADQAMYRDKVARRAPARGHDDPRTVAPGAAPRGRPDLPISGFPAPRAS